MQQTPLFSEYEAAGGKVVDFHGWALPVQFAGILQEHEHTRTAVSLFDCSHMAEFRVRGKSAVDAFHNAVMSDVHALPIGRIKYGALLNEDGGIIDDITTYKIADDDLFIVTNAGPRHEVASVLAPRDAGILDITDETSKLDIQGPKAREVMLALGMDAAAELKYYRHTELTWEGHTFIVSRTGYTGELGWEIYVPNELAITLWNAALAIEGVKPAGLGARDTLRTEVGYGLSGQDFGPDRTPLEAGMERFIAWDTEFQGKEALAAKRDAGGYPTLTAIQTGSRRAPRHDFEVKADGTPVGTVTSGTFGPSVGQGIGLAYIDPAYTTPGTSLTAGPKDLAIETTALPFYDGGSVRT